MQLHNTTLKNSLLLTAIATCATLSTAQAATELNDDAATPQRTTMESVIFIEQTPGALVAQQQSEALQYQKLVTVLGDSFVTLAKQHLGDTANLETLWNATFSPHIPYNDSQKHNIFKGLLKIAFKQSNSSLKPLGLVSLQAELFRLEQRIKEVPLYRIEASALMYFKEQFPGCTVTTFDKRGGDQLGCVVEISLSGGASTQVLR